MGSDIDKPPQAGGAGADGNAGADGGLPAGMPQNLRFLKALVTLLTLTMILGIAAIVAILAFRLPGGGATVPALPAGLTLPEGQSPRAITFGTGWVAIVTDTDEILVYDAGTGALRQRLDLGSGG